MLTWAGAPISSPEYTSTMGLMVSIVDGIGDILRSTRGVLVRLHPGFVESFRNSFRELSIGHMKSKFTPNMGLD